MISSNIHDHSLLPAKDEVSSPSPQGDTETQPGVVGHEDQHETVGEPNLARARSITLSGHLHQSDIRSIPCQYDRLLLAHYLLSLHLLRFQSYTAAHYANAKVRNHLNELEKSLY